MSLFAPSLPRLIDPHALDQDPFAFLHEASLRGDAVVIREGAGLFSPEPACPGVAALFGQRMNRRVLASPDEFLAPTSTARAFELPEAVVKLNRSLHSMAGQDHRHHKTELIKALQAARRDACWSPVLATIGDRADTWRRAGRIALVSSLRQLTADIAVGLLFGPSHPLRDDLRAALERFFVLRRSLSLRRATSPEALSELTRAGTDLDRLLRSAVSAGRPGATPGESIHSALGRSLGEDAAVSHLNVLFMSIVEPVTVAAAWLLLALSQRADLRRSARDAYRRRRDSSGAADALDLIILETLRLLSPNALMVRAAARDVDLDGIRLPKGTEILLVPFLSHRDPESFQDPHSFRPSRWQTAEPSPFGYLPFGAGHHACPGRTLASALTRAIAGEVLTRMDLVLTAEQEIDWALDITFKPRSDIEMSARPLLDVEENGDIKWRGPISTLIQF